MIVEICYQTTGLTIDMLSADVGKSPDKIVNNPS
jgi:hypothetical protein